MRILLCVLGLVGGLFLHGPGAAQRHTDPVAGDLAANEFIVFTTVVSSRRNPENLADTVRSAMANPVIGPVIVVGAAYLGVPPESVAALGAAAAESAAEQANRERQEPRGGYQIYSVRPPANYALCAVRFGAISIHPRKENRPKVWSVANGAGLSFHVDHKTPYWMSGRSTVKTYIDVIAVRNDARATHAGKCLGDRESTVLPLCRGADCDPYMTRTTWVRGT